MTGVDAWSRAEGQLTVGTRITLEGASIAWQVRESGRPTRLDTFVGPSGPIAEEARELGIRSSVGCPIVVGGRLWGVIAASTKSDVPFPADTESMIGQFTELVGTAIANAQNQAESRPLALASSSPPTDAAADRRDLHDGAQQRLVSLALQLNGIEAGISPEHGELKAELSGVVEGLDDLLEELRETARGIHPAILSEGGLEPALKTLARRSTVPVTLEMRSRRGHRTGRSCGVLRRLRDAHKCGRAAHRQSCASMSTNRMTSFTSSFGTTASVGPTRPVAPGSSD